MAAPAPPRQPGLLKPSATSTTRAAGVLPVSSANIRGGPNAKATLPAPRVASSTKLKLLIRRLPPGLRESELLSLLGDEWRVGGGKVDWTSYKSGKVSKDPAKPSRPGRYYVHVLKEDFIVPLSEKVRSTSFADARGSSNDPALLGPPIVEYAPYGRVPSSRVRKDARQGTIDQDQEFIDFLESLTNVLPKPAPVESSAEKEPKEPVVTPLIQYLRDKKANKNREQKEAKDSAKSLKVLKNSRPDPKDVKPAHEEKKTIKVGKENANGDKKSAAALKVEKAAREAVRVISKQPTVASSKPAPQTGASSAQPSATVASPATAATAASPAKPAVQMTASSADSPQAKPERRRERGNISAAARILQRDLGLGGSPTGRRRREAGSTVTTTATESKTPTEASTATTVAPTTSTTVLPPAATTTTRASSNPTPALGGASSPAAARPPRKSNVPPPSDSPRTRPAPVSAPKGSGSAPTAPAPTASSATTTPKPTTASAFLKHANPSQGITEPLLEATLGTFGPVVKVEIDKKKGFAYVDFTDAASLQKAIAASPVKVAQGQVVVLERKSNASLRERNSKPATTSARSGGGGSSPTAQRVGRGTNAGGRGGRSAGGKTPAVGSSSGASGGSQSAAGKTGSNATSVTAAAPAMPSANPPA